MALTKSEFEKTCQERERLKAEIAEKDKALALMPKCDAGRFNLDGDLYLPISEATPSQTRALYEMLRAWYGETTMTEKAKAALDAAVWFGSTDSAVASKAFFEAIDAYRAEQKDQSNAPQ